MIVGQKEGSELVEELCAQLRNRDWLVSLLDHPSVLHSLLDQNIDDCGTERKVSHGVLDRTESWNWERVAQLSCAS